MNKIVFNSTYSRNNKNITCCSGERVQPVYTLKVNVNGTYELIKTSTQDVQEQVNSFHDSTVLESLIIRYNNGDVSALGDSSKSFYGDFSNIPANQFEAEEKLNYINQKFNANPDLVNKFHTFNNYLDYLKNPDNFNKSKEVKEEFKEEFKKEDKVDEVP